MELHKKFYIETGKTHRVFVAEGTSVGVSFWYHSNDYVKWLESKIKSLKAQLKQAREIEHNLLKEMELISSEKARNHGAQKCPKCDGQGIVSKPSWVAGDQQTWSDTQTSHVCDVCNGVKLIYF